MEIKLSDDIALIATEVSINEYPKKYKLELVNQSGKKIDLSTLSSEKPIFTEDQGFNYELIPIKTINFNLEDLKSDPRSVIYLLHELAHSEIIRSRATPLLKFPYYLKIVSDYILADKFVGRAKRVYKEERDAWALALKYIRQLKDVGFDLVGLFESISELKLFFRGTHELNGQILSGLDDYYGKRAGLK